jgi:hypothetical protein
VAGVLRKLGVPALALAWAGIVFWGVAGLVRYQMTPTASAAASLAVPRQWPDCRDIVREPGRFTLVMALHPQCPCSRASVHELAELTSRTGGRLAAVVMFVVPAGAPRDWLDTDLVGQAKQIPGVKVIVDRSGVDAARFGASTSGQVALYDVPGRLLFSGGITDGRGHEGDNAGLTAILDLVRHGNSTVAATPVYGCPLGTCPLNRDGTTRP